MSGIISTEYIMLDTSRAALRAGVEAAVKRSFTDKAITKLQPWLHHVPKKNGDLLSAITTTLEGSPAGTIAIGAPGIDYAGYVNEMMPKIEWTNKNSVYQWFEKLLGQAEKIANTILNQVIREFMLTKIKHLLRVVA
jgi:hypothetical protein